MQIILHESAQRTATGNSGTYTEPDFKVRSIFIKVSQISLGLLGNVTFKLQHSENGEDWIDVPNLTTGGITATGNTTLTLDPSFATFDNVRLAWTFNNANSVTFIAATLGAK